MRIHLLAQERRLFGAVPSNRQDRNTGQTYDAFCVRAEKRAGYARPSPCCDDNDVDVVLGRMLDNPLCYLCFDHNRRVWYAAQLRAREVDEGLSTSPEDALTISLTQGVHTVECRVDRRLHDVQETDFGHRSSRDCRRPSYGLQRRVGEVDPNEDPLG